MVGGAELCDSDFSYSSNTSSDLQCEGEGKGDSSDSFEECYYAQWQKVGGTHIEKPSAKAIKVTASPLIKHNCKRLIMILSYSLLIRHDRILNFLRVYCKT
jgi:hypothetical protein